jgi:hypothetical protein
VFQHRLERIIFILDRLARICDSRGIALYPSGSHLSAAIENDAVTFGIKEYTKHAPHVLTEAEIAMEEKRRGREEKVGRGRNSWDDVYFAPLPPAFDAVRTGEFSLKVNGWNDGLRRSWRDGKKQTLETLIEKIVDGLETHIVANRLRREAQERADAEHKELELRHELAMARSKRESERKWLLQMLIRTERQAAQLRNWIARHE